jgi:putative ABC transport system ATP-binding protein
MNFLTLENVTKTYQLGATCITALDDVSLTIKRGEFTVIWGASGSGKSTLLNVLAAIDVPDKGNSRFDSQLLSAMSDQEITRLRQNKIGIIFQSFNLVPVLTALENVMLPGQLHGGKVDPELKNRALALMAEVGVEQLAEHLPDQLSGGQRQRVALARALINKPELVIADEPTANLDSQNSHKIVELLAEMNRRHGTTFIFSTHDQMLIDIASRKVKMKDGKIVGDSNEDQKPLEDKISFFQYKTALKTSTQTERAI